MLELPLARTPPCTSSSSGAYDGRERSLMCERSGCHTRRSSTPPPNALAFALPLSLPLPCPAPSVPVPPFPALLRPFRRLHFTYMHKKFALLLFVCFFLSILAVAFHHHEDGLDHDDCSICFCATHHTNSVSSSVPQVSSPAFETGLVFFEDKLDLSPVCHSPYSNRAPPA